MEEKYREALSEIYEILLYIDQKSFDELPFEVVYKISENRSKKYEFKIDKNETKLGEIIENKIKEETKEILAYLYLKYWSENEDENLEKELIALEETMKAQNLYDIFTLDMDNPILEDVDEKKIEESQVKNDEEKHLTEIKKENIFVKIKNLILKLFSKFRKKDKSDTE